MVILSVFLSYFLTREDAKGPFTLALMSVVVSAKRFLFVLFLFGPTVPHSNTASVNYEIYDGTDLDTSETSFFILT